MCPQEPLQTGPVLCTSGTTRRKRAWQQGHQNTLEQISWKLTACDVQCQEPRQRCHSASDKLSTETALVSGKAAERNILLRHVPISVSAPPSLSPGMCCLVHRATPGSQGRQAEALARCHCHDRAVLPLRSRAAASRCRTVDEGPCFSCLRGCRASLKARGGVSAGLRPSSHHADAIPSRKRTTLYSVPHTVGRTVL